MKFIVIAGIHFCAFEFAVIGGLYVAEHPVGGVLAIFLAIACGAAGMARAWRVEEDHDELEDALTPTPVRVRPLIDWGASRDSVQHLAVPPPEEITVTFSDTVVQ